MCMHNDYPQNIPSYYIGLTQWHHPDWQIGQDAANQALSEYSKHFSSVEGNSSFYGLPSTSSIENWKQQSGQHFKFCFKFPQTITHHAKLQHCDRQVSEFLNRVAPLENKLGTLWLQLNASFSPKDFDKLSRFIQSLPPDFNYGIEVRHTGFFLKDDTEKRFNQLLMQHTIDRITFDTRALFAHPSKDAITQEALRAKPRMPVHAIATGMSPFVRIITPLKINDGYAYLMPWVKKTLQWIDEERTPYLFFHTPDNKEAPEVARFFSGEIHKHRPDIPVQSIWDKALPQPELF